MRIGAGILFVTVCGCQLSAPTPDVEANDLGVASLELERTSDPGAEVLSIRGLDASGDEVALVTLRTGVVYYEPDWGDPTWTTGSDLAISAGQQTFRRVTPDLLRHSTPDPIQPALASFVHLRAVAAAIAQAGITFTRPGDEVAFTSSGCSSANFAYYKVDGTALGNTSECCQETNQAFKIGAGANLGKLGLRDLNASACRLSDRVTGCTGTACYYGPCATDPWGATGTSAATVFVPTSPNNSHCGYDDNGATTGGEINMQYGPYTNQTLWTGVTSGYPGSGSGCQATWCVNGTATYGDKSLTVTGYSSGAGYLTVNLPSYTLTNSSDGGTGYYWSGGTGGNPPAQTVVLTMHHAGSGWKAHWYNGYCNYYGSVNVDSTCSIPMTAARTQSFEYICAGPGGCLQ